MFCNLIAAIFAGITVQSARLDTIPNDSSVVTGVSYTQEVDTNVVNTLIRSYDTTNLTARIAAKQDKISDYTTTNAVANIIATNKVNKIYGVNGDSAIDGDLNVYGVAWSNSTWTCSTEPSAVFTQLSRYRWKMDIDDEWYGPQTFYYGWVEQQGRYYISPTEYLLDGESSNPTTADARVVTIREFGRFIRTWTTPVFGVVSYLATTNYVNEKAGDAKSDRISTTNGLSVIYADGSWMTRTNATAGVTVTNTLCTVAEMQASAVAATNYTDAATNALPSWTKSANKPTYTASEVGALPTSWATNTQSTFAGAATFAYTAESAYSASISMSAENLYDPNYGIWISPDPNSDERWIVHDILEECIGTIAYISDIPDTSALATKSAVESVSNTVAYLTATQATHTATLATKIDGAGATSISENVVGKHLYYSSTNLADNVELRLFSGEWVNAEYDGVGTADVILDLTGVANDKVTDTLMVLNCAATGTLTVSTSANACRVVRKKDTNPLELKAGLNLLTFSRYRMANGTNEVLVTNNEME